MFTDTINKCAANAARIARLSANNPLGFWVSSAMAGAYVGLGIILIFTLGNLLDPSVRPLVMGATFGIALTLVIIAGSELFTGHTMFLTLGVKAGTISHGQMWAILPQTWLGNLVGSVFVALLYSWGGGSLLPVDTSIVHSVALAKTTAPAMVLFFKGAQLAGLSGNLDGDPHRRHGEISCYLVVPAGVYRFRLRALRREYDAVRPLLVWSSQRRLYPVRNRTQPVMGHSGQYFVRRRVHGIGLLVCYAEIGASGSGKNQSARGCCQ